MPTPIESAETSVGKAVGRTGISEAKATVESEPKRIAEVGEGTDWMTAEVGVRSADDFRSPAFRAGLLVHFRRARDKAVVGPAHPPG